MVKTKTASKYREKAFLALSVIGLSLLLVGSILAQYVPQKIGFLDVKFANLDKEQCQECHGDSMVEEHHSTSNAVSGNCVACHSVRTQAGNVGVSLERNCITCHEQSPHHITETAKNKECTACHNSPGVSDYSTEVPSYQPSQVTPTASNCRLCHGEGVVDGRQIADARGTHHGISFGDCKACHDEIDLSTDQEQSDEISVNIRVCERCHNVKVLHEVVDHVETGACAVCHGGKAVTTPAASEETVPPESEETVPPEGEEYQ
jgi:hypothetical protein